MFISTSFLEINYGVDDKIARFFVDREPPVNNLYWHQKLLYLRPAPGYLFIPLIVDLLYKIGVNRQELLSEQFVTTMEQVGHISALEETQKITVEESIKMCVELVGRNDNNKAWYKHVVDYFSNNENAFLKDLSGPFKALNRGDLFLFSLAELFFSEEMYEKISLQWFALIGILLLLDDAEDIKSDMQTGDKNAFIESGLDSAGFRNIETFAVDSLEIIKTVNQTMAAQLTMEYNENVRKQAFFQL